MSAITKVLEPIFVKSLNEFYSTLDLAHGLDHFRDVYNTAKVINDKLGKPYRDEVLFVVAYVHDLYSGIDRDNHHTLSGKWVRYSPLAKQLLNIIHESEWELVALACEQHRASYEGEYSNLLCEIMASADRGFPKDAQSVLDRAILYRKSHSPEMSEEEVLVNSIEHIKEKFGRDGYARYPSLYTRMFDKELENLYKEIDKL